LPFIRQAHILDIRDYPLQCVVCFFVHTIILFYKVLCGIDPPFPPVPVLPCAWCYHAGSVRIRAEVAGHYPPYATMNSTPRTHQPSSTKNVPAHCAIPHNHARAICPRVGQTRAV
jgi:hypothetical protein